MAQPQNTPTTKPPASTRTPTPKKNLHSLFETIVHVDVGPEPVRFAIHKGLLCSRSEFFRAALTGNFQEAEDQVVTLDDEDPEIFRRFNAWLYTDMVAEGAELQVTFLRALFDLYVFAEKRIIPDLQNAVIDAIIRVNARVTTITRVENFNRVWEQTAETSALHRLLVDSIFFDAEILEHEFTTNLREYSITFVAAVAIRANELVKLEFSHPSAKLAKRKTINQWLRGFKHVWWHHCQRYHVHKSSDAPCKGHL